MAARIPAEPTVRRSDAQAGADGLAKRRGRGSAAARRLAPLLPCVALAACLGVEGKPPRGYEPTLAPPAVTQAAPLVPALPTGAIYSVARYAGLAEDNRARRIGDLLTIALVERTVATKQAGAGTSRKTALGLTLPTAKPFSDLPVGLFSGGADFAFDGEGRATQSNQLKGEITVTVADVLANGVLVVRGQKIVRLNRGDEFVQISGLVRPEDIGADNRVASTRVADARIGYSGTGEIAAQSRQGWLTRLVNFFTPF